MRKAFLQALVLFVLLSLSWVVFVVRCQREQGGEASEDRTVPKAPASARAEPIAADESKARSEAIAEGERAVSSVNHPFAGYLAEWEAWFATGPVAREALAGLAELRSWLDSLAPAEARALMLAYLDSGRDAGTGLIFDVGPGGVLRAAPSLRTFFLDELGRRFPEEAREVARMGLAEMRSADEHALHLRNFVWGGGNDDAAGDAFLRDSTRALVNHAEWRAAPTAGFAEAFDVVVYLGLTDLAPRLARDTDRSSPPHLRQASYLSLDRLVINEAPEVLSGLLEDLSVMDGQPFTRAGFFARADPSEADGRRALEAYLLSGAIQPDERSYFFELFPNLNLHISDNLLTGPPDWTHESVVERLRAAREQVRAWQGDARFSPWMDSLRSADERLGELLGEGIPPP